MRSKVTDALDRVDRLLDAARKGAPEPAPKDSEWDIDTARHEIEELKAQVAKQPSSPEIHVHVDAPAKHESEPPATSGLSVTWKKGVKLGKLPPWATVVIALTLGIVAIVAASIAWIVTRT
jgi:hypothetical protein